MNFPTARWRDSSPRSVSRAYPSRHDGVGDTHAHLRELRDDDGHGEHAERAELRHHWPAIHGMRRVLSERPRYNTDARPTHEDADCHGCVRLVSSRPGTASRAGPPELRSPENVSRENQRFATRGTVDVRRPAPFPRVTLAAMKPDPCSHGRRGAGPGALSRGARGAPFAHKSRSRWQWRWGTTSRSLPMTGWESRRRLAHGSICTDVFEELLLRRHRMAVPASGTTASHGCPRDFAAPSVQRPRHLPKVV